mgnify:CR=1 FL=1
MAASRAGGSPAKRTLDAAINQNMLGMAVSAALLRLQQWIRISPPFYAAKFLRNCAAGNTPQTDFRLSYTQPKNRQKYWTFETKSVL